jgi:hypothetical protein
MSSAPPRAPFVAFLALAALVVVRLASAQLLSPGPLSRAHASLEGDARCNDCHSTDKRVAVDACLGCHKDIGARIAAGQGLHGRQYKGKACEGCHAEHLGGGTPVRWPGGDPSRLDHALTGWVLKGAHQTTGCNKCHDKGNARGAHTYLGAQTACASCHKDVHDNRFGANCASCHEERAWKNVVLNAFNHDLARYPLRGAHQTTPCAKCHADPPKYTGLDFGTCTSCHEDIHRGRFAPPCTNCHTEVGWKPASFRSGRHPGPSLANGHARVACRSCHDRGNLAAPSKGTACVSCHAPVHEAPFGTACVKCHASIEWLGLPRSVGLGAHPATTFPLTGSHERTECAGCHKPSLPEPARYRGLASARCADCHEDKHRGEFAKRNRGECAPCHTTAGFRSTTFGLLAHASTRFPLEGAHTASPCSECHTAPRPRLDLRVSQKACASCHQNPHGDQFVREMKQDGCAHCHEPNGWHLPKIDHGTWPLTGAHAAADCDSCHQPTKEDRKAGRGASYRGVPRNCAGCHADAHLGQFRLTQPVLECDRCHGTSAFAVPNFDHEGVAGWALTGAHTKAACGKCHTRATLTNQQETTRWRLPSAECSVCHANPHRRPHGKGGDR